MTARLLLALSPCLLALSGCGSKAPREAVVGTWGLDVSAIEAEGASLTDAMQKKMHQNKLAAFRAMRLELGADGSFRRVGTPFDGAGAYELGAVDGDTVSVTFRYEGRAPEVSKVRVLGDDRIVLVSPDGSVSFPLIRR
ncbi:MAG: hypothetical protein ACON4Z_02660 [Planctomycetota bacterium]